MANYDNNLKCGLWKKEAKSGLKYYSGKISIDGVEYYASLFNNDAHKDNPKAPAVNLVLKPVEESQGKARPTMRSQFDDPEGEEVPF